jgi:hypothetical protein
VIDLTRWTPPDISTVGDDPFGKLVKYGHRPFTNAANEIGPAVSDAPKRLAGNNLACGKPSPAGRHAALCHAYDMCLGPIPAVSSAGGRRCHVTEPPHLMEKLLNSHPLLPVC